MKALIIIGLIAILGGCGRPADISKAEIPARYDRYKDLFSSEESWENGADQICWNCRNWMKCGQRNMERRNKYE